MPIIQKKRSEIRLQEFYTVVNLQSLIVVRTFKESQVEIGYKMLRTLLGDRYETPRVKSFRSKGRFLQIENWSYKYAVIITRRPLPSIEGQVIDLSQPMLSNGSSSTGLPCDYLKYLHEMSLRQLKLQTIINSNNIDESPVDSKTAKKFSTVENYYVLRASDLSRVFVLKSTNVALPRLLRRLKRELGMNTVIRPETFKFRGIPITIQNYGNRYIVITTPFSKKLGFVKDSTTGLEVLDLKQLRGTKPDAISYLQSIQDNAII